MRHTSSCTSTTVDNCGLDHSCRLEGQASQLLSTNPPVIHLITNTQWWWRCQPSGAVTPEYFTFWHGVSFLLEGSILRSCVTVERCPFVHADAEKRFASQSIGNRHDRCCDMFPPFVPRCRARPNRSSGRFSQVGAQVARLCGRGLPTGSVWPWWGTPPGCARVFTVPPVPGPLPLMAIDGGANGFLFPADAGDSGGFDRVGHFIGVFATVRATPKLSLMTVLRPRNSARTRHG